MSSRTASAERCELGLLVRVQVDLEHLLEPAGAEPAGHAHVQAVEAVLALEQRSAGEHPLLVVHDRVDHLATRPPTARSRPSPT